MLLTNLNMVKPYSNWGWAGGYFWHLKELMVTSGRFTVCGSGDGFNRFAYSGITSALPGEQQGSGGGFDCLQNPKFSDAGNKQDGYWNASGWAVMNEVGSSRQYLFVNTTQTASNWDGHGRIAYNPGGGAQPTFLGSSATAIAIPGLATNEQWLFANRATDNGVSMGLLYGASGYINLFCETVAENGVTAFGFMSASDSKVVNGLLVVPLISTPSWELDPVMFYTGTSFGTTNTFNQFGYGPQTWATATIRNRSIYNGTTSSRYTNGTASVLPMLVTSGSAGNAYIKGYTGNIVGYTMSKWAYPTLVQDDLGNRWIPGPNGLMIRWPDTNPVTLPR